MKHLFFLVAILSGVMWGSAGVFVRELSAVGMSSTTIVLSRVLPATFMMLLLILATDRSMLRIKRKDAGMFVACGLSMLIVNVSYTISAETLSLSLAAVLLGLSPVFMLILARAVFGERITAKKVVCMVAAVFGCVLVSGALEGSQTLSLVGAAIGLFGAFIYAAYGILTKRASSEGYSIFTTLFYCLLIVSIALIPFSDTGLLLSYATESWTNTGFIILHAAMASFLPFIFYSMAMVRVEAGAASILASCGEPTAAAIFGLLIYVEIPSVMMVIGMIIAIGSMAVMCSPDRIRRHSNGDARSLSGTGYHEMAWRGGFEPPGHMVTSD